MLIDQAPGERITEPRLAGYTGYLARLAAQRAAQYIRPALPPGRTPRDLDMLCVLAEGPVSQARLGAMLEVNRTVMISVIDDLESARLVRRERDAADRRRYALRITDEGAAALERMRASVAEAEAGLTAVLGPGGARRLAELLGPVVPDLIRVLPQPVTAQVSFLLDSTAARLRRRRERAMRDAGLEPRCVAMLIALDSAQPCPQERLADRMGVAGPTIVPAVDELHSAGLIARDRNPADRRARILRLTPDGEKYLTAALAAEDSVQRELAALIGPARITELNALLTSLSAPSS
jgi:DNA-binding MarR family transcriptional regulator